MILGALDTIAQQSVLISPSGPEAIKFNNVTSEKITLFEHDVNAKYGIGIGSGLFKQYVATVYDDFVFGVGSNTSFAEKFRIKGNGIVQTKNRITLGDAGGGESAGLWFNSNGNTAFNTFLGIDPTNKFGIFSPLLIKNIFSANMVNGSIRLEGPNASSPTVDVLSIGGNGKVSVDAPGVIGGRLTVLENGKVGIGTSIPNTKLEVAGEITSTNTNAFRMIQGNFGAFWRNDGLGSYFLLTNSGDQYGTFNNLRPITIDNVNGNVAFGNQTLFVHHDSHINVNKSIYIDANSFNSGSLNNALNFGGVGTGEGILSKRTAGGNQFGLDFLTQGTSKLSIANGGNITIAGKIVNEDFQPLSLQNSWIHNGAGGIPSFYKDKEGRVHLKGAIASGVTAINTIIATLPVGYRPPSGDFLFHKVFSFGTPGMSPDASIVISPNGEIRVYLGTMHNTLTTLDGISFRAE